MEINRIYPRNRRIPGRATGATFFDLRWTSGRVGIRDGHFQSLSSAIKFLKHHVRQIPLSERSSLSAELFAEIRRAIGSCGRISLGRCVGEKSLQELFERAEYAWNNLEQEDDDQKVFVPDVIDPRN